MYCIFKIGSNNEKWFRFENQLEKKLTVNGQKRQALTKKRKFQVRVRPLFCSFFSVFSKFDVFCILRTSSFSISRHVLDFKLPSILQIDHKFFFGFFYDRFATIQFTVVANRDLISSSMYLHWILKFHR